jgi:hypothetical protein
VSRALRTPRLPPSHGSVGYRWQNTGSCSLINMRATSCRTSRVGVGALHIASAAPGPPPLRHCGDTLAPTPTRDYRPSLRSPWPAAKECINNGACLKQLRHRGEDRRVWRWRAIETRPGGGKAQARAVREQEDQREVALVSAGAEDRKRLPVEGMAGTPDRHPFRVALSVLVVGIVSCSPSVSVIRRSPAWRPRWPWRRRRACGCSPRRRGDSAPRHSRWPYCAS